MSEQEKIISELQSALEWCQPEDNPNGSIAVKIWAVREAVELLKEQEAEARLLTAEEVQNMEAGTAFGIETYYDHDGERMPGCAWALRTERLILSYFGTMFPDTVTKIPYNTLEKNQNTGKHEKHQYRFWSKKPTFEQCKAVKWDD